MKRTMQHSHGSGAPAANLYDATGVIGAQFKVLLSGGVTKVADSATGRETVLMDNFGGLIAAVHKRVF